MLNLYRRCSQDCKAGRAIDTRTTEGDERKPKFKHCDCMIFMSGTLGGKFKRQRTGEWEWGAAKQVAAQLDIARAWFGQTIKPTSAEVPTGVSLRSTMSAAVEAYMNEHHHNADGTKSKYQGKLKQLAAFGDKLGYVYVDQWTPADILAWRGTWDVKPDTGRVQMTIVKSFFRFALVNEWLNRDPTALIKSAKKGRDAKGAWDGPKVPFSDAEIKAMLDAAPLYDEGRRRLTWKGQDVADFILLSIYTGMRISDVTRFNISKMRPDGSIHIRTAKGNTPVYTWVPSSIQNMIRMRAERVGPFIFGERTTKNNEVMTNTWRNRLVHLWSLCPEGTFAVPPTPHRLRHTFARILLQRPDVSLRYVSELLGNTEAVVRKYYSAWMPDRQNQIIETLKVAFADAPFLPQGPKASPSIQ